MLTCSVRGLLIIWNPHYLKGSLRLYRYAHLAGRISGIKRRMKLSACRRFSMPSLKTAHGMSDPAVCWFIPPVRSTVRRMRTMLCAFSRHIPNMPRFRSGSVSMRCRGACCRFSRTNFQAVTASLLRSSSGQTTEIIQKVENA